jgi:menaquinol-cytochrome c reductase iron-sulfur subunit
MADEAEPSRRRTLTLLAGASAAGALGVAGVPALRMVAAGTSQTGEAPWVAVARLAELREGEPRRVKVVSDETDGYATTKKQQRGMVWLVRQGAGVRALSAICPHLGCAVDIGDDGKTFHCPCHDSSFTLDGERAAGKPNQSLRGMDPLEARVAGEHVEVRWKRYALGTESREVIG